MREPTMGELCQEVKDLQDRLREVAELLEESKAKLHDAIRNHCETLVPGRSVNFGQWSVAIQAANGPYVREEEYIPPDTPAIFGPMNQATSQERVA